jgi:uncharacterized repeat protein (TIGR01451 family)
MKIFLYFLLIILCINIACAYDEDNLEWACGNSKKLNLGETISNGNYTVEAYNFPKSDLNEIQFVGIKLYENGILVADQTLVEDDNYIYDDEIRITAIEFSIPVQDWTTDLPEEPWAKIKMEPRGMPRFDVEFETDKDDYSAYSSYIEVDLTIQNTGDAKAHNMDIYMDTGDLEIISGKAYYHYNELEKGELVDGKTDTAAFDPITLRFVAPSVVADTAFNIAVNIEYYDLKGMEYSYSESYPVKVLGMFSITKSINDNIYINEIATVTISLRNYGVYPINTIKISDTLPPYFELNKDPPLEWELNLKPGECRSFTYSLKPLQPNEEGYVIPAAIAQWSEDSKICSARSNSPCITVYGPKIELSKTVNPDTINVDGIVTVTIEVKNTGNVLANIDVTDYLPGNVVLTDGVPDAEMVLRRGESQTFGYSMKMNMTGSVELPPAVAHFVDTQGYDGTVFSETRSITVNPVITPHDTQTIDTLDQTTTTAVATNTAAKTNVKAGAGLVCMLVGFFAAVFVIMRGRRT